MADFHHLEFFLLRYAGDTTRDERINLGVIAIAPGKDEQGGFADVRFIRNFRRLHCFDPLADDAEVQAIEREIRRDLQDPARRTELLKRAGDAWSNTIRFERMQGCLTQSPSLELERLSAIYLEMPALTEKRELTGRQRIVSRMRDEFEKAGVLALMQTDIAVAEFTRAGDPLRLDFGYPIASGFKFLHAVSLAQRVEHGMMLAARFPQIAAGMRAKRNAPAWLTAVVDDELPQRADVTFTLDLMQETGIVVARAAEIPEIAARIRAELRR